ncbi:MAG TPA: PepSY domain-containing protein [Herbaspirillum sp.]|jgi:sulfite reductase (NADPH) flavoprotein alpha-component
MGTFKKILFQIHWFVGITAGSLLMMVGVTGATLSFSDEIINALNPGVMHVARQSAPLLEAPQLFTQIQAANPDRPILALTLANDKAGSAEVHSARVNFAPPPGQRRGELRYADPYNGKLLPSLRAEPFFKWIEFLHRFLLLPTPIGKVIMGSSALCLFFLALSGLYLRWPRQALQWRAWFRLDFSLQGRSFLWHLHSMLGTWALVMYLISSSTGAYWSLDWLKQGVDGLIGQAQAGAGQGKPASKPKPAARKPMPADQFARVWQEFTATVPAYRRVMLRLPERAGEPVQINYLEPDAPHDQALSRMRINPQTGAVGNQLRYRDKSTGERVLSSVYVLHMGTLFGLPGRILMTLAALCLPLFGITGWMLYLDRRRKKRAVRQARNAMDAAETGISASAPALASTAMQESILIVFASQSGYAERIALRTAAALKAAGLTVDLKSIARIGIEQLSRYHQVLFVASSFDDGDPPDSARGFTRQLLHQPASLGHLHYGVLALGDRHYRHFCGFGHTLDFHLQSQGAQSQFAMIEVDNGDPAALALWQHALSDLYGIADLRIADVGTTAPATPTPYEHWTLLERRQLNPGSQGEPIFHLTLKPDSRRQWQSGALVEILPRHTQQHVADFLHQSGLNGSAQILFHGTQCSLAEALARAALPSGAAAQLHASAPQALADSLKLLTSRRYSVSSIASDGTLQLLVRQSTHEGGFGIASGWLTAHAAPGGAIEGRLLDNPAFALSEQDVPGIFIGNGSGMAGLRSHLRARVHGGRRRNWLLFGERSRAHDALYKDEIAQWQRDGFLARVDLAFSRDQAERIYVQDKLREAEDMLLEWLAEGAVIYVCGSMEGMAAGVDAVLSSILGENGLEELITANRYRRDIY